MGGRHRQSRRLLSTPSEGSTRPPGLIAGVVAGSALAVAALAPLVIYPRVFGDDIHPLGPDMFGYVWQTRVVGSGPLSLVGTRPGLPVLGAMLSGFRAVEAADVSLLIGLILAVALGLTVAVAVRLAFRLPAWSLGVIAPVVTLWGGSLHLSVSYLSNGLSLSCMTLALALVALPGRAVRARTGASLAAAIASGLAHPGFVPFFLGVAALWVALSVPRFVAMSRAEERWWEDAAVRFLAVVTAATAMTAAVVFGAMGSSPSDLTNIADGTRDYRPMLDEIAKGVGLRTFVVLALAVVGVAVAWRRRVPSSGALTRAGVAWAAVSAAGALAALVEPAIPGHRALLVVLPLPAVAGLGLAGVVDAITGAERLSSWPFLAKRRWPAASVSVVLVLDVCLLVAVPGLSRLHRVAAIPLRGGSAALVASYLGGVEHTGPVVVLASHTTPFATLSWRGRENQIRAYGPDASLADTFVVVAALSGPSDEPTVGPPDPAGLDPASSDAADASWRGAGPALAQGATIVVPQAYVTAPVWTSVTSDPSRIVTPGLAVLRGPGTSSRAPIGPVAIRRHDATVAAFLCLLALVLLGGGFGLAAAAAVGGSRLDALALAPAVGIVLLVLVGVGAGLTGLNPRGAIGLTLSVLVAFCGYVLAWRRADPRELKDA